MEASICTDRSKHASVWHIVSDGSVVGEGDDVVEEGDNDEVVGEGDGVGIVGEEGDDVVDEEGDDVVDEEGDDVVEFEDDPEAEDDPEDEESFLLTPYRTANVITSSIAITRKMTKRTMMKFLGALRDERRLMKPSSSLSSEVDSSGSSS